MGFKCGIIGLPNVGKSTLFNALTRSSTEASNFPFCTIKPQIGIVPMPDIRLEQLSKIVRPQRVVPTTMEFVDIAGLVKGASKGEGLGNQFLANIRETEAIGHVVRCFEDKKIIHVNGTINPERDIDVINTEMAISDLDTCKRALQRVQKKNKDNYKKIKTEASILERCLLHLEQAKMLRTLKLNTDEKTAISYLNFLTLKPTMYIANVNENSFENNSYINQVSNIAQTDNSIVVPVCASIESDISKLRDEEFDEFIIELGLEESSLKRVIRAGYELLNLQTYFTVGVKEVRAWTISMGINALKAASKIHTDFEKGFIRAQVIAFKDFIEYKGERGAKEAGKIRLEGKNYIVNDGDIINFLFNV